MELSPTIWNCRVKTKIQMKRIGIDIGRVIIGGDTDQVANIFFSDRFLETTMVPNAFSSIQQIVEQFDKRNIYLVSKCGPSVEKKTLKWLTHHQFYIQTGVLHDNVHFCRERKDKKGICSRFNINVFIDDRYSVLKYLNDLEQLFLFNPTHRELEDYKKENSLSQIAVVNNWQEVMNNL